jgi:hypothetical protein
VVEIEFEDGVEQVVRLGSGGPDEAYVIGSGLIFGPVQSEVRRTEMVTSGNSTGYMSLSSTTVCGSEYISGPRSTRMQGWDDN